MSQARGWVFKGKGFETLFLIITSICVSIVDSDSKVIYIKTAYKFGELFHDILNGVYPHCKFIKDIQFRNLKIDCRIFSNSENVIGKIKANASADTVTKIERFNMLYFKIVVIHDKEFTSCIIHQPVPVKVNEFQRLINAAKQFRKRTSKRYFPSVSVVT